MVLVYLDSAQERLTDEAEVRLDELAIGARMGHATDASWRRWMGRTRRRAGDPAPASSPATVEQAVLGLAITARRLVALPGEEQRRMKAADMAGAG